MNRYTPIVDDVDETAVTGSFARLDPDATSSYDIHDIDTAPIRHIGRSQNDIDTAPIRHIGRSQNVAVRRRQIRDTRENLLRLREALAAGWDISHELAHEERCLAELEAI
jgi:hypothetical protein